MSTDRPDLGSLAQRCWGALEVLHIVGYFAPEPAAAYAERGLRGRTGYFAARSAAMGPVSAEVTIATFYVFAPSFVRQRMDGLWAGVEPAAVLDARHRGVSQALHGALGEPDVAEALDLARTACAALQPHGRALYAAHAGLPWPDEPLLALWHAATLLREHRGDGHVATLLLADLDPLESIITGGLTSRTTQFMRQTRGWTDAEWAAGEDRLRERGILTADGDLSEAGTALRRGIEDQTRTAALPGWTALGQDGSARLLELVAPLAATVAAADIFPPEIAARFRR